MYIVCDFDGTLVTHEYPEIGEPIPHANDFLKELVNEGHILILGTMRGIDPSTGRDTLQEAIDYCEKNQLGFTYYNENPNQNSWTNSRKIYGNLYIDDAALGCPLTIFKNHKVVNWIKIKELFL